MNINHLLNSVDKTNIIGKILSFKCKVRSRKDVVLYFKYGKSNKFFNVKGDGKYHDVNFEFFYHSVDSIVDFGVTTNTKIDIMNPTLELIGKNEYVPWRENEN